MAKSAFVAIVGRPSSGKSTLLNALCGAKVSIVSPVPQTTRNAVRGIVNREEGQLVFIDTPGFHLSEKRLNIRLKNVALGALGDADIIVYVLDSTREPGAEEESLAANFRGAEARIIVAVNKTDAKDSDVPRALEFAGSHVPGARIVQISALKGQGLDALVTELFAKAEEGPEWYPAEYYTDQDPVFRIAEIIREKAINHTREELPHALYIDFVDSRKTEDGGMEVSYDIVVERESQKGIVIGKGGSMIKVIREESQVDLAELFDYPIHLRLQVRVDPSWKHDEKRLDSLIF
ncbi:MAG: GTPase Era [Spirochaetaceae bacterium]|nr:GTPase Era [Spirochaetaceae bacterium]